MFTIAYDMTVAAAKQHHPRSCRQAYLDIELTLNKFGYERVQDSVFVSKDDDLANLFRAMIALMGLGWFGRSVKDVRAFRMEQGSDFTAIMKGQNT